MLINFFSFIIHIDDLYIRSFHSLIQEWLLFKKVAFSEVYIFTTILNTNRSKNIDQLKTIDLDTKWHLVFSICYKYLMTVVARIHYIH